MQTQWLVSHHSHLFPAPEITYIRFAHETVLSSLSDIVANYAMVKVGLQDYQSIYPYRIHFGLQDCRSSRLQMSI